MGIIKKLAVTGTTVLALVGGTSTAVEAAVVTSTTTAATTDNVARQALVDEILAVQRHVPVGQTKEFATIHGFTMSIVHRPSGFHVKAERKTTNSNPKSACTYAVAGAVYALGASALAAAAASGGLEVAGVFLAPEILENLSLISGSFSAIYDFIAANVC